MSLLVSMPEVEEVSFSLSLTTRITARRSDQCYILFVLKGKFVLIQFSVSFVGVNLWDQFD